MTVELEPNPYLQGNYAPVLEEREAHDLPVEGAIPPELNGIYLRNGSNPQYNPLGPYHWFDGDGMIHAVELRGGKASYRNRWVETKGLLAERKAGRALFGGLLWIPDAEEMHELGPFKNPANTNVVRHAGKLLALYELGLPYQITPQLDTVGEYDFDGKLQTPMTAHPKVDGTTGEMLFFGYSPLPPYLTFHQVSPDGRLVTSVPIDVPAPVMMHDFAITDEHVVFFDCPVVVDVESAFSGGPMLRWQPERGTRLGVMPRAGDERPVQWFDVDPCFLVHTMNAFVDGDCVVVDVARFERMWLASDVSEEEGTSQYLHRYRLNLATGKATDSQLDDMSADFPRIDDRLSGRPHRFGYMVGEWFEGLRGAEAPLLKYDLVSGERETCSLGPRVAAGEAVFVPHPQAKAEDEGWLLSLTHDHATNQSELVIVDARDFRAGPIARVKLPQRVPFGFHGSWLEDEER